MTTKKKATFFGKSIVDPDDQEVDPVGGNCRACGVYLNKFRHNYVLEIVVGAKTTASSGTTGLGTMEMVVCPDCIRDFLETYGLEYPDLMDALHTVNEEERNPV